MLDRILIHLDVGAPGALGRAALGAALLPALRLAVPDPGPWATALALAALLFGIKVFTAVARRLVPVSPQVRAHWDWRRNLARYHDSYQWKKVLWFGLGLSSSAAALDPRPGPGLVGAACAVAGAIGQVLWWRKGMSVRPPEPA